MLTRARENTVPRLRPTRLAPAAVTGVVGLVVALVAVVVTLLPQVTPASTAAVKVPDTRTGYSTVTISGARLARLTTTVGSDGATVTGATVSILGLHLIPVDIRIGTGTTAPCAWRGWENLNGQTVTNYQCTVTAQRSSNAAVVIRAGFNLL